MLQHKLNKSAEKIKKQVCRQVFIIMSLSSPPARRAIDLLMALMADVRYLILFKMQFQTEVDPI
jgi:hypothetical protein